MANITENLNALRTLVHEAPTLSGWAEICARLDGVQSPADLAVCLDYLEGHLSHWPMAMRQGPAHWLERRLGWEEEPRWSVVRALTLRKPEGASEAIRRLIDTGALAGVAHLTIAFGSWQKPKSRATALDIAYLTTSPTVSGLEVLILDDQELGAEGAQYVGYSPRLSSLRRLSLRRTGLGDRGATFLAQSPALAHLDALDLAVNGIGDDGAVALSRAVALSGLRELALVGNRLSGVGAAALAESTALSAAVTGPWQHRGAPARLRGEVGGVELTVFEGERLTFGREGNVRLFSIRIPEHHFEARVQSGELWVEVLSPELRLVVNGARVESRALRAGDRISSGPFEFVVEALPG